MGCDFSRSSLYEKTTISIHAPIVGCDRQRARLLDTTLNFNPRTHRGVRRSKAKDEATRIAISIHAPIVGCDRPKIVRAKNSIRISIHAPIVGCDWVTFILVVHPAKFQSTHPSWGATMTQKFDIPWTRPISIHAPIVGCDICSSIWFIW